MKPKRISFLDRARSIAIILVVLCHSTESIYPLNLDFYSTASIFSKYIAFILFTIGRLSVPIFLSISGYLLLDKTYDDQKCRIFWGKNCMRLFVTTEIWIILYNIFLQEMNLQTFSPAILIREMLFTKQTNLSHMWYMPMILGMYVFIPFAANAVNSLDKRIVVNALVFTTVIATVFPIINVFLKSFGYNDFFSIISTGFSGGVYGLYLVLGFLCRKDLLKNIKTVHLVLCCVCLVAFTIWLQMFAYAHGYPYNVWYDCGALMFAGLLLFEIVSRINWKPNRFFGYPFARYAFAIYLIHNPVLIVLNPYLSIIKSRGLRVLVLCFITICISWTIAYMIDRIPHVGKILLYTD